jgi:photosystem II stability/assembly factor-like uncharacterized protein
MRAALAAWVSAALVVACQAPAVTRPLAFASIRGSGTLTNLSMIDGTDGWAYGAQRLARTADGAQSFVDVTPPGVNAINLLRSHFFLDARRAWLLVGPVALPAHETLDATSDGGATWTQVTTIALGGGAAMTFVDSQHGWLTHGASLPGCVASGTACSPPTGTETTLEQTTDGGSTWSVVYRTTQSLSSAPLVSVPMPGGTSISLQTPLDCGWASLPAPTFVSAEVGFVGLSCPGAVQPQIATTRDGGRTWRHIALPVLTAEPGTVVMTSVPRVRFFSPRDGVAFVDRCTGDRTSCMPSGFMARTLDGGATWSAGAAVHGLGSTLQAVDDAHAWLLDGWLTDPQPASLLITADAGLSWEAVALPANLAPTGGTQAREFELVTQTLGFAVTWTPSAPDPKFYRTDDGGRSFVSFVPRLS